MLLALTQKLTFYLPLLFESNLPRLTQTAGLTASYLRSPILLLLTPTPQFYFYLLKRPDFTETYWDPSILPELNHRPQFYRNLLTRFDFTGSYSIGLILLEVTRWA